MYNQFAEESSEMKYVKEQIEREQRKLDGYTKKLQFEEREQQNRAEQFKRKQRTEMDKLQAILVRQLNAFKDAQARNISAHQRNVQRSQLNVQQLQQALIRAEQEYERDFKRKGLQKDRLNKNEEFSSSPEALRIKEEILHEKATLTEAERTLKFHTIEEEKRIVTFSQNQKRETEKLLRQQERENNAFADSWERAKKFLEDKIQMTQSMVKRYQDDFAQKKREYEMEVRKKKKEESDHRAQHGSDDIRKNFATPDSDIALSANSDVTDFTDTNRRMGGARW